MISSQPCARKMSLNGTFFHTMGDGNIHMISSLGAKKEVWEKLITLKNEHSSYIYAPLQTQQQVIQHQHLKVRGPKLSHFKIFPWVKRYIDWKLA